MGSNDQLKNDIVYLYGEYIFEVSLHFEIRERKLRIKVQMTVRLELNFIINCVWGDSWTTNPKAADDKICCSCALTVNRGHRTLNFI